MRPYDLDDVLAGTLRPNEPIRYRDLVLRRKFHTREYTVTLDADYSVIEFDAEDFDGAADLKRYLDQLSSEVDAEATPITTPVADGGTPTADAAHTYDALEREFGLSVSMGMACIAIGLLSLLGAGATMATAPIGVTWMVQLVAGLLLGGVGLRLRGGRR